MVSIEVGGGPSRGPWAAAAEPAPGRRQSVFSQPRRPVTSRTTLRPVSVPIRADPDRHSLYHAACRSRRPAVIDVLIASGGDPHANRWRPSFSLPATGSAAVATADACQPQSWQRPCWQQFCCQAGLGESGRMIAPDGHGAGWLRCQESIQRPACLLFPAVVTESRRSAVRTRPFAECRHGWPRSRWQRMRHPPLPQRRCWFSRLGAPRLPGSRGWTQL